MLSVNDLIDINYIPLEKDISLKLLVDFYENYLCKRIFIFTLKEGQVVKVFFRDATELFHISGIDHIYEDIPMDGSRFIEEIKDGNIDLETVKSVNTAAYKDYEIRIRSIACIDTIIKNCDYLWYPSGKIPGSQIDVKYLLLKGLDNKNLHLGIDTYKANRPYFTRTLLITEGKKADKFIGKADERLRVSKLEIRDKDTNQILINVKREIAEQTAYTEVAKCAKEWLCKELPILLEKHILESIGNEVPEFLIQHISFKWLQTISELDENLKTVWSMKDEKVNLNEWLELLITILDESLSNRSFVKNMIFEDSDLVVKYEGLLIGCVHAAERKEWITVCRKYIEGKKVDVKSKIESLDYYWAAKLSGEANRKYIKEELNTDLTGYINEYMAHEFENIVSNLFVQKIIDQKKKILERIAAVFN